MAQQLTFTGYGGTYSGAPPTAQILRELRAAGYNVTDLTITNRSSWYYLSALYDISITVLAADNESAERVRALLVQWLGNWFSTIQLTYAGSSGYTGNVVGLQQIAQNLFGGNAGVSGSIGGSGSTYTVRSGDTMSRIAARYNMTLAQLMALNPQIRNANVISVGQVINVSGSGGGSLGIGGSIGGLVNLITGVNPSTGQVTATPTPVVNQPGAPPSKDTRNWFDKTFFDGAGALTGVGIGVLVVLGAVVVTQYRNQ